jgi:two-component system, sensor histidine kinase and response regulator
MLNLKQLIQQTTLPVAIFESLRQLWNRMAQSLGEDCFLLTETALLSNARSKLNYFTIIISEKFSGLLVGKLDLESSTSFDSISNLPHEKIYADTLLRVKISFDPDTISNFIAEIADLVPDRAALEQVKQKLQPNDLSIQSQFTLAAIAFVTQSTDPTSSVAIESDNPAACGLIEEALQQQKEQESLVNQVIVQIRQSLDVPVILSTAVQQARQLLQADRLLIFEFDFPENNRELSVKDLEKERQVGTVTYEARSGEHISSVLSLRESDRCFTGYPHVLAKYHRSVAQAISDIETAYVLAPCFLNWMRQIKVKAKLVAPIIVGEQLWGLLIAHQCEDTRDWKPSERQFLLLIAEHLAVAIQQAQLYTKVQQQAQTLEQRVIESTQELREALIVAEAASRAKGEFLATMSHELKTPLTSIIGLSETLLRWSGDEIEEKRQSYLKIIRDRGQHLQEIINDILDLAALEAKELSLNIGKISLERVAQESIETVKKSAVNNSVRLVLKVENLPADLSFYGDAKKISQILVNLLSNGIKFTPKGGKVTLRIWIENDYTVFEVKDTGIGIPESQQHLLFQKFKQLDSTYTREYQGMGLGLALTKQLVELHQGTIDLRSTVGTGSTFTVRLPILTENEV